MRTYVLLSLAAAGAILVSNVHGGPYATTVVNYNPGTNYAPGYTNTAAVIGQPSVADSYGDAVDPFDPPYETSQILSIGSNGWLTVEFDPPIVETSGNPFGRDFTIFGNSFFVVTNAVDTNYNYIGTPATSGELATDAAQTTVSVSRDGINYYRLNPAMAPTVNTLFPTDSEGDFQLPVKPALTATNFAGATLDGIAALYQGSAGGTSYSIAWAQDTNGNPVSLYDIRYVRIDVQSGRVQVAGFSAVTNTNGMRTIVEDFVNNPAADGWGIFGDTNLLVWQPGNENLAVTWDTSQPNSYFYHPLHTILGKQDSFSMSFDLYLTDIAGGLNTNEPYNFELATGFQNFGLASQPNFYRGGDALVPDLVEFDYFPADPSGDEAAIWPGMYSTNNMLSYNGVSDQTFMALPLDVTMRVTMCFDSDSQTLSTTITTNGVSIGPINPEPLETNFTDFRVDTFAVENYSGAGQDPSYGGSMLAHGTVANIVLTVPPPPVLFFTGVLTNGVWQGQFLSKTNWTYIVQRSSDLKSWTPVITGLAGTGSTINWQDSQAPTSHQFYRVSAIRD
jgi:hypothetical protein